LSVRNPGDVIVTTLQKRAVRSIRLVVAGAISLAGCADPLVSAGEGEFARAHLDRILQTMETYSINRNTIDWPAFRATVLAQAPNPRRVDDTFPAIHTALGLLGDNHSSYIAPPEYNLTIFNSQITCMGPLLSGTSVPADIGYVRVRSTGDQGEAATRFASTLHQTMRTIDTDRDVVGWIVDLRGNGGGNMWPMIAGIGPILGEGPIGHFVNAGGFWVMWEYKSGAAINGGITTQTVTDPYTLRRPNPNVAVLLDGRVASSGEATAIAFKGRPNTRFFGTPTCGLSTANAATRIDDATLILTVGIMADRNRLVFGDSVVPDEFIENTTFQVDRAIEWLREQAMGRPVFRTQGFTEAQPRVVVR
jgi:carboxyl-terminal processing protease